jgi:type II secretory pathway pseudopilin PulG
MTRVRSQDGFTLPELLTTMTVSMVVLLAVFAVLDTVMKRTAETQARIEATQRGRVVMDTMTRQLRSQTCPSTTTPAIADASPNSVTFYTDLTNGAAPRKDSIEKRVLAYDPATKRITQSVYRPTGADPIAFNATATTRVLATDVVPDGGQPVFRYYAYAPAVAPAAPQLTAELVNPVAADRPKIAQIKLAFVVQASRKAVADRVFITMRDDVFVRSANPNDTAPIPLCA